MKIIIQAGGKGTRLEGLTHNKPKCLVPVNNLPILFYAFKKFADAGIGTQSGTVNKRLCLMIS